MQSKYFMWYTSSNSACPRQPHHVQGTARVSIISHPLPPLLLPLPLLLPFIAGNIRQQAEG
jgi:hypothetical protein